MYILVSKQDPNSVIIKEDEGKINPVLDKPACRLLINTTAGNELIAPIMREKKVPSGFEETIESVPFEEFIKGNNLIESFAFIL